MQPGFKLINSRDLPEHVEEEMKRYMIEILRVLAPANVAVAFGALQGAMSYYLLIVQHNLRDRVIEGFSAGLKKAWRENEGEAL
jgi:hypothetical protein